MGLDMYLRRKMYVGANYDFNGVEGSIDITIKGEKLPINFKRVVSIVEEGIYWRKANAIHKWFVDNVQKGEDDCGSYYVDLGQLRELLAVCKQVKEKAILAEGKIESGSRLVNGAWEPIMVDGKYITNASEIAQILPTQDGFFFGSTNYNEYYMNDVEYTIEELERLIKEEEELNEKHFYSDFEYHASW